MSNLREVWERPLMYKFSLEEAVEELEAARDQRDETKGYFEVLLPLRALDSIIALLKELEDARLGRTRNVGTEPSLELRQLPERY